MHDTLAFDRRTAVPAIVAAPHNAGFDALRASLTLLVIFHHTAITYGAQGGWYYHEIAGNKSPATSLLLLFCTINQAYFMGLFFLLAGYFSPHALHRKGTALFLLDRGKRLGLPLLFYGCVLGPLTIALAAFGQGHSFARTLLFLWRHAVFENGPLWFAQALLIFSLGYALAAPALARLGRTQTSRITCHFPTNRTLIIAALGTGLAALVLRVFWPVGVNAWGLQLGYFSSYVVLFAAGCAAAQPRWLEQLPAVQVRTWCRISLWVFPVLPLLYFLGQALPILRGRPLTIAYALWEPMLAWGMILFLLDYFQRRFVQLNTLWSNLSRRAYTIYIIHPPVLVAVALMWRTVPAYVLLKFVVTGGVTCLLCIVIAGGLLRLPRLREII